jgi:hypothetical protein
VFCPKCGESLPGDAEFCIKCGHKIEAAPEEKSPKSKEAEEWLSKAKALKEEGIANDNKGKIDESLAAFDTAIGLDPKNGALWYEKGVALGLLERFDEAVENFETALKLDPENEDYKAMLKNAKDSIAAKQKKEEKPKDKGMPSIAMEIKHAKKLKESEVVGAIESLMGRTAYQTLKALEEDVAERLKKEGYDLKDNDIQLIKDMVIKHGHTGKFAIDDMIARKFGGGKRAALIVSIVLILIVAVVTEILIPMMGERLMNEPPTAQITSPENNIVLTAGQDILFSATAEDKEDEQILGSNFVWSSDTDGELGVGSSKSVSTLSPGTHTITLMVRDSKGAEDVESVVITIQERKILHEIMLPKTVTVGGKEEGAYIRVWEPLIDEAAPDKGWLEMENPFYSIKVNLDHSYYLLYDKALGKDLLIYNDKVENKMDMLTGADMGYGDLDGNNQVPFSTTARDDVDGIGRHQILYEDKNTGFLLIDTEGWDFQVVDPNKGYDVESEVMFGVFADKPYFIDATEVNNLQAQGAARRNDIKNPNTVIKSWVLTGEYDSASIKGGDTEHLNKIVYEPYYEVQSLAGEGRKPWHAGSAEISKMFPDHVLAGNRLGGSIIFSLPHGKFRWDDSQDVFGGQVVAEFLLSVERPQKAVAYTVNAVSRESFLYDAKDYATITGYAESLGEICERYGIGCIGTINPKDYKVKRFAYVITLTSGWYDASTNQVKAETWSEADSALEDFKKYEDIIYQQLRSTKPLFA